MRNIAFFCFISVWFLTIDSCSEQGGITIDFNEESTVITYGANRLSSNDAAGDNTILIQSETDLPGKSLPVGFSNNFKDLGPDGFQIITRNDSILILGKTDRGCLYGTMDLVEQLGPDVIFQSYIPGR